MELNKLIAIGLIVAGTLGLAYGGFTYTKTHHTEVGPLSLSIDENKSVNVPIWVSIGGIVIGCALLLSNKKIL